MRTPYGAWRATYTQGRWVVLSGPTSMVIMGPAVASPAGFDASGLVNEVWDEVLASASIAQIVASLTRRGLDAMPDLGVLFWDDEQLHCLLRGRVRVLDAESGGLLASGEGALTWYETNLTTRRVHLPLDDADTQALRLPLVVGAVQAATIFLDADDLAVEAPAQPMEPELVVRVEPESPELEGGTWLYDEAAEPLNDSEPVNDSEPLPVVPAVEPTQLLAERPPYAHGQEPGHPQETTGLAFRGFGEGASGTTGPWGAGGFAAALAPQPQQAEPPEPEFDHQQPSDSIALGLAETSDSLGFAPIEAGDLRVLAVLCPSGHSNSPGSKRCRICNELIAGQIPRMINRPVLAVVATPAGDQRPLRGPIVVGRAPSDIGNDPDVELLRVPSPNHDISRSHLRIAARDWQIEVSDLHSTNGTVVTRPDGERIRLEPGEKIELEVGGLIDVGDGQVLELLSP